MRAKINIMSYIFIFSLIYSHNLIANAQTPNNASSSNTAQAPSLSDYLADKDTGQVSASAMVGVNSSAITNIQTSQDIVFLIKPSDGTSKSGYGLSITPARTSILPMPAYIYYNGSPSIRLLGALTLSYASKDVSVDDSTFTKRAISVDSALYFDRDEDPVIIGFNALHNCTAADEIDKAARKAAFEDDRVKFDQLTKQWGGALDKCLNESKKTIPWNAARMSFTFSAGEISGEGIRTQSMGKAIIINAMFPLGQKAAVQPVYRKTWGDIDLNSLKTDARKSDSNLLAVRLTYGLQESGRVQVMAEVSNLKRSTLAQSEALFRNAIGADIGIAKGVWLQLRYGDSQSRNGENFEKKGLLSINFSPSCALSAKCGN